jgi:hypothetical protein
MSSNYLLAAMRRQLCSAQSAHKGTREVCVASEHGKSPVAASAIFSEVRGIRRGGDT